ARAGEVGEAEALRDHAVEPRRLDALEPVLGGRQVARERREADAFRRALRELGATLLERAAPHLVAVPEQEVEDDVLRRDLRRELADAALGRVQSHLHGVEVEVPLALDDDLAVERRVRRQGLAERPELREVAEQRTLVAAPERELAAVVLEHAAEAVPLRLVLPAVARRELLHELGLHRREGNVWAGHEEEG